MTKVKKAKNMFVDNAEMYKKVCKYKLLCERAKRYGAEKPPVPESLANDITAIAENLSYRDNFRGYAFREDMIQDGVEHVLKYIYSFDTEKYKNVFGWVSKVLWQCYGNRINLEKKQLYLKFKMGVNYFHEMSYLVDGGGASPSIGGVDVQFVNDFIETYEKKHGLNKDAKKKPVEDFSEKDIERNEVDNDDIGP